MHEQVRGDALTPSVGDVPDPSAGDLGAAPVGAEVGAKAVLGPGDRPRVDVVIPAYNREAVVGRAVASALGQQGFDIRVWVVDDGSADATAAVGEVLAVADERVRMLRHATNRGVSAARNTGIAAALADGAGHLVLLDSDDLCTDGALGLLWDALAAHQGAGCAQGHRLDLPEDVVRAGSEADQRRLGVLVTDLFLSGLLVRAATFERAGTFDESLRTDEDLPWFAGVADAGLPVARVPAVTLLRSLGEDNLTRGVEERRLARLAWVRSRISRRGEGASGG